MPADRSVFGIEAWGLHGRPPQDDFVAMAEEYAANIAAVGDAPPVIIGWCFGGHGLRHCPGAAPFRARGGAS